MNLFTTIAKCAFIVLMLIFQSSINAQTVYYVNIGASGTNTGTSWNNAFTDLQPALNAATSNDTIWVAKGLYLPSTSLPGSTTNSRNNAFFANGKNVSIYGGFKGTETTVGQRNIIANPTIFSGDLNNDDLVIGNGSTLNISGDADNCYHVFVFISVPQLNFDGVHIKGGNANNSSAYMYSGVNVWTYNGGGIHHQSTTDAIVTLKNTTLSENTGAGGGGMYSNAGSSSGIDLTVNVINSTIERNRGNTNGAGIYAGAATDNLFEVNCIVNSINSTFTGNFVATRGGGIYCTSNSTSATNNSIVNVSNSTFYNNAATNLQGGGIHMSAYSGNSIINISSSIFSNTNNFYSNPVTDITSSGYNIFSDTPAGAISSDQVNISNAVLNLQPIAFFGGTTRTLIPAAGSPAINTGNPTDFTRAQNRAIIDTRRDVGAGEYNCFANGTFQKSSCNTSYTWLDGNTYTSNNNTAIHLVQSTNAAQCDSLYTLNLTFNSPSSGNITQTACSSYIWYGNTYSQSGSYTHNLTNVNGCDSVLTLQLTINTVNVAATLSGVATLTANISGANYQWINCSNNSPIAGATNSSYTATANGSYAVIATVNGCSATSACVSVTALGIENLENSVGFSMYPNPSNAEINVNILDSGSDNYSLSIYNALGKVMLVENLVLPSTRINVEHLSAGLYFVKVAGKDASRIQKLVIR